jgi:hypothetical protein
MLFVSKNPLVTLQYTKSTTTSINRTHRTVVPSHKNHRRRCRRPFTLILGSARANLGGSRERMVVIFLLKEQIYPNFLLALLEGISRKKLSQNSCSGFTFTPKKKGFINRGYLYIFISQDIKEFWTVWH